MHIGEVDFGNNVILKNDPQFADEGFVVKYNKNYNCEWARKISGDGSDYINSVTELNDGGYVVVGQCLSEKIEIEDGIIEKNHKTYSYTWDGIIVKYSKEGNVEEYRIIGGSQDDVITDVTSTKEGGFIIVGSFKSENIELENTDVIKNSDYNRNYYSDGMIIKYDSDFKIVLSQTLYGKACEEINKVIELNNEDYVVVGTFNESIFLKNGYGIGSGKSTNIYTGFVAQYTKEGDLIKVHRIKSKSGDRDNVEYITKDVDDGYVIYGNVNKRSRTK